jgi:hypothetical protein
MCYRKLKVSIGVTVNMAVTLSLARLSGEPLLITSVSAITKNGTRILLESTYPRVCVSGIAMFFDDVM